MFINIPLVNEPSVFSPILTLLILFIVCDTGVLLSLSLINFQSTSFSHFCLHYLYRFYLFIQQFNVVIFQGVISSTPLVPVFSLSLAFSIIHPILAIIPLSTVFKYASPFMGLETNLVTVHGCLTSASNTTQCRCHHPHICLLSALSVTECPLLHFHIFHFTILFPLFTFSPFASLIITLKKIR